MPGVAIRVTATNIHRSLRDLKRYKAETVQAVKDAVNESALNIQKDAKKRVNVDTGNLRSRIVMEPVTDSPIVLKVGTYVKYGIWLEYGTGIYAVNGDGRKTPWAFPVSATSGKKNYNFPIKEINGEPYYLTRGSKPHPFLFPAFEAEKPNLIRGVKEALKN